MAQLQNPILEIDARIRALHHIAFAALLAADKEARAGGRDSLIDAMLRDFLAYDPKALGFAGENLTVELRKKELLQAQLVEAQQTRARNSN